MAVANDARQSGTTSTGAASLTWNHTVGAALANSILLVSSAQNATITGINWDQLGTPAALTSKGSKADGHTCQVDMWFLKAPSAGTKQVKVTYSGSCICLTGSSSWQGVDQTTPFNAASPQSATGTIAPQPSLTVTSAVGEWVVDVVSDNDASAIDDTLVKGGSQTSIYALSAGAGNIQAGGSDETGAASVVMSWTGAASSNFWAQLGVSLTAAQGGGQAGYVATKRPARFNGPYDPNGFLLSPFRQYDYTPSTVNITVLTDIGALALAGFSPVLDTALGTGVGSLTLGGFVPTIGLALNAGVGSLTLTSFASVIDSKLNTGMGSLLLGGFSPVLDSKLNTGLGALTLSGFGPTLDSKINAGLGSLSLGGFVPSVLIGTNIQTDFGTLTLVGLAPVLDTSVGTDVGSLIFAGLSPDIQGVTIPVVDAPRTAAGGGMGGRRRARRVIDVPDLSNVKNLTELHRLLNYPEAPKIVALPVTVTDDEAEMQEIIAVYFALLDYEDLS